MATVKISELGGLAKGTATDNDVVPIVNGGTTKKMTLSNLRGKLRGASNTGGSCAALVGGINNNSAGGCSAVVTGFRNTNTNGGEWIGGGQDNTVDDKAVARSLSSLYGYPELNGSIGSYSTILGGARNCINMVTASVYDNAYSIAPNVILSGVDNVIESKATSTSNAYWPYAGQNLIGAGAGNIISASSNSGNYPLGANTILNGAINCIQSLAGTDSNSYMYHNTIIAGMCNKIEGSGIGMAMIQGYENSASGSYASFTQFGLVIGGNRNKVIAGEEAGMNSPTILGSRSSCIVAEELGGSNNNSIFGGAQNKILAAQNIVHQNSSIIGGRDNIIQGISEAVILGGVNQTAVKSCAAHVQHLVIQSTSIPTSDPGVLGQVWVDTTAGNTLKISL